MLHSTQGIVLNHIKYKETSIIVNIYTQAFGRQSYIVNNVRSTRKKGQMVLLQPLTLLDLQVYHRPKVQLQRIKEFKVAHPLATIPFTQEKRALAFFVTELLVKVLREEEQNLSLFEFLYHSIVVFDTDIKGVYNFHLFFLFQLSKFLGFAPSGPVAGANYFDLMDGQFKSYASTHGFFLEGGLCKDWQHLFELKIEDLEGLILTSVRRNHLLQALLQYYQLHLEGLGEFKTLTVLHQLFHTTDGR